jgi:hypothetical protein
MSIPTIEPTLLQFLELFMCARQSPPLASHCVEASAAEPLTDVAVSSKQPISLCCVVGPQLLFLWYSGAVLWQGSRCYMSRGSRNMASSLWFLPFLPATTWVYTAQRSSYLYVAVCWLPRVQLNCFRGCSGCWTHVSDMCMHAGVLQRKEPARGAQQRSADPPKVPEPMACCNHHSHTHCMRHAPHACAPHLPR